MAQLEKIGAIVEWRWGLKEENKKEDNRNDEKESENGPGEDQKEKTLLSAFCQYNSFVFLVYF